LVACCLGVVWLLLLLSSYLRNSPRSLGLHRLCKAKKDCESQDATDEESKDCRDDEQDSVPDDTEEHSEDAAHDSDPFDDDDLFEEVGAPVEVEIPPAPAPPKPLALFPQGLREFDFAATSRSECMICKNKILKGDIWLSYRFKESHSFKDERRVHPGCCRALPSSTREVNIQFITDALAQPALGTIAKKVLGSALSDLLETPAAGGTGASSSTCPP